MAKNAGCFLNGQVFPLQSVGNQVGEMCFCLWSCYAGLKKYHTRKKKKKVEFGGAGRAAPITSVLPQSHSGGLFIQLAKTRPDLCAELNSQASLELVKLG